LPLVIEDLHAQVDFFCLVCTINYIPSQTSHVGAAPEAAALLMYVSHIQRMRLEQRRVHIRQQSGLPTSATHHHSLGGQQNDMAQHHSDCSDIRAICNSEQHTSGIYIKSIHSLFSLFSRIEI
jgi:hypothetical protein